MTKKLYYISFGIKFHDYVNNWRFQDKRTNVLFLDRTSTHKHYSVICVEEEEKIEELRNYKKRSHKNPYKYYGTNNLDNHQFFAHKIDGIDDLNIKIEKVIFPIEENLKYLRIDHKNWSFLRREDDPYKLSYETAKKRKIKVYRDFNWSPTEKEWMDSFEKEWKKFENKKRNIKNEISKFDSVETYTYQVDYLLHFFEHYIDIEQNKLYVPSSIAGFVIGKGGWKIKLLSKYLGIEQFINIVHNSRDVFLGDDRSSTLVKECVSLYDLLEHNKFIITKKDYYLRTIYPYKYKGG